MTAQQSFSSAFEAALPLVAVQPSARWFNVFHRAVRTLSVGMLCLPLACASGAEPTEPDATPEAETTDFLALDRCANAVESMEDGVEFEAIEDVEPAEVMCKLRSLDALVEGRQVVCLGEGSHGVSQSNAWRAHFVRYLVHAHGFRTVVLENSNASMLLADEYVQTGDIGARYSSFDDARGSLGSTQEAELFLDAMRALQLELEANDVTDRLQIRGLDIAVQPRSTRALLLAYIGEVEPAETDFWETALPDLGAGIDYAAAGDAAEDLVDQLDARRENYVGVSGEEAWSAAVINAENLRDGYRFLKLFFEDEFLVADATYREPSMTKNLERLRGQAPNGKMLILAHNKHCHRADAIGRNLDGDLVSVFGTDLATSLGDDYAFVAQLYADGEERVIGGDVVDAFVQLGGLETAITTLTDEPALLFSVDIPRIALDQEWPFNASVGVVADQMDAVFWLETVSPVTIR